MKMSQATCVAINPEAMSPTKVRASAHFYVDLQDLTARPEKGLVLNFSALIEGQEGQEPLPFMSLGHSMTSPSETPKMLVFAESTQHNKLIINMLVRDGSATKVQWNPTEHPRLFILPTYSDGISRARRSESRPDPITLREIALVIGVVAIGLHVLPRPMDLLAASVLPPVYFLIRMYPSLLRPIVLLGYLALIAVPFLPAWITGEPSDLSLGNISLLFTVPGLAWLETWGHPIGLWEVVDRLFLAYVPFAVPFFLLVIVRLFDVGALSWN